MALCRNVAQFAWQRAILAFRPYPIHKTSTVASAPNFNVHFPKLLLRHPPWGAAHKILRIPIHRKGNYLPDILFSPQQHNHPVYPWCHACMGRAAEPDRNGYNGIRPIVGFI